MEGKGLPYLFPSHPQPSLPLRLSLSAHFGHDLQTRCPLPRLHPPPADPTPLHTFFPHRRASWP